MHYVSTRAQADPLDFEHTMMAGLARDGGLYVPDHWPHFDAERWRSLRGQAYAEVAREVMAPFVDPMLDRPTLGRILCDAYSRFTHRQVAPLVQLGPNRWLMELHHGPTLAFKDVALQVLGRLYDHVLSRTGQHITLIGATSGDTGSAAIEAVRGRSHSTIFIMHPHERTSEVQRRQMTTVDEPNVHNIAIEGSFDDCQALLKAMFNDAAFRDRVHMSGVNSINWARVLPQVVYYVTASLALGGPDRPVSFAVPTGNFGDVYAGYVAMRMGLPIRRLIVATNVNDILTRALATGDHALSSVTPTMSPSMDIQVSSNFERLLFDAYDRNGDAVRAMMQALADERRFVIDEAVLARIRTHFCAGRADEEQTIATMRRVYDHTGMVIDPHTAVGVHVAEQFDDDPAVPMVVLSTAHPAKFPAAVARAIGQAPQPPARLAAVFDKPERFDVLPNDLSTVKNHILERTTT